MAQEIPLIAERIVKELIARIAKIKEDFITGVYLTGSIPLDDFLPGKSDIDFLITCKNFPTPAFQFQLKKVHKAIEHKFRNAKLNGWYITSDALDVQHSPATRTLCFQKGRLRESAFEMAPVTLYELKTTAVTLMGIPARDLPVAIEQNRVDTFLHKNINTYWKNWISKHSSPGLHQLLLVLFPRLAEWVVLGVARQLYTLKTGRITSKTAAGYYCLELLPDTYRAMLDKAIKIRNDKNNYFFSIETSYYIKPSIKRAREAIACANYIVHLFNDEYKKKTIGQ